MPYTDKQGLTLDRDKLYARAEELLKASETEDERQLLYSEGEDDEREDAPEAKEPEQQVSASPADEPAQDAPANPPEPAPLQQLVPPQAGQDLNQELLEMNRQLLELQRSKPPRTTQVQQEQVQPQQYDENNIVLHGELAPLRSEISAINSQLNMTRSLIVQREVEHARQVYAQFKKENPDCDELIPPAMVEQAISGLGQIVAQHAAQGKPFQYNFLADLQQDYDLRDVKRLREQRQKEKEEAELNAKQEAELQKASGVPTKGARYQTASEGTQKKKTPVDPDAGFTTRLRARVADAYNRLQGNA